jgi:prepilin-type processing-associated H-X9-DG protein
MFMCPNWNGGTFNSTAYPWKNGHWDYELVYPGYPDGPHATGVKGSPNLSDYHTPSQMWLLKDGAPQGSNAEYTTPFSASNITDQYSGRDWPNAFRHIDQSTNAVFVDGHAKAEKPEDYIAEKMTF